MKLGTETGSMTNWLMSRCKTPVPQVGDACTIMGWTDRHAATIIEVSKSGKRVVVQRDTAIRTDDRGMSEAQEYRYERNPQASKQTFSLRKNGAWKAANDGYGTLFIGEREEYHDFSF